MRLHYLLSMLLIVVPAGCNLSLNENISPAEGAFYSHDGVRIYFNDIGKGRPLVFIHGFGASQDSWRYLVKAFKEDYRLVLLDLKGHGYSDRPYDYRYSIQDHADIVSGLISHLKLSNVILVGHSFGSAVALFAALRSRSSSPPLVSGLVLIAGSVDPHSLPLFLRLLRIPGIGWLSMNLTSASFRTRIALTRAYYDDSKVTDSVIEMYARYLRIPGTDHAMLETAKQFVPPNLSQLKAELKKLEIPILHVYGDRDIVILRKPAEEVCGLLSRCSFVTLKDVGHVPQEERPELVIPLLRERLGRIVAGEAKP
ncbi:MAG: alpha/beta hydrolase [Deltaproteobacteria bacterium]|nr:alpha/beta hydrolase [Deltaproteobacteria bacterium]